jgi:deoxyribodipyrimidine photolyase-related protein
MDSVAVIFPHQLFRDNPCLKRDRIAYLVEDPWFFGGPANPRKFHRQKLALHRASLQAYREFLESRGFVVRYLEFTQKMGMGYLIEWLKKDGVRKIVTCDTVEKGLTETLTRQAEAGGMKVKFLATPMFLCSEGDIEGFFQGKEKFHQTSFYVFQRRSRNILLENGKPLGGRWTYDPLNRRKLPRGLEVPGLPEPDNEPYVSAARDYVSRNFLGHPGDTGQFIYPVTHQGAQK